MWLEELLKNIPFQSSGSLLGLEITGLQNDSRQCQKGDLFFALSGTDKKGLDFASEAEKNGAVAILHDCQDSPQTRVPLIKVTKGRQALAEIANRFFGSPTKSFYLCGITGTNGKTTLTFLLEKIFQPESSGVIGTVNIRFKGKLHKTSHTTPDPILLQSVFAKMKQEQVQNVAMEVSSHALDQSRTDFCHFDSAVFTNLTQDHLDYHKNMEGYFTAKKRLFLECLVQSEKPNKLVVINQDDPYGKRLFGEIKNLTIQTFSCLEKATLRLLRARYSFLGTQAEFEWQNKNFTLATNLIGKHNVQNIMAAFLIGIHSGRQKDEILEKMKNISIPGRLEKINHENIFVDYAHSPDALKNVISALHDLRQQTGHKGRLIVVFGCGGDRDKGKREPMGETVAKMADVTLITSDNPRTEDPREIINDILEGVIPYQKKYDGVQGYLIEEDREKALKRVLEIRKKTDIVLIAGKGHEDYQIIGKEKRFFDDREIVKALLA